MSLQEIASFLNLEPGSEKYEALSRNLEDPARRELIQCLYRRHLPLSEYYDTTLYALWHCAYGDLNGYESYPSWPCGTEYETLVGKILLSKDLGDHSDLVLLAVKAGLDPNLVGIDPEDSPLAVATLEGRTDIVEQLIALGADPNLVPSDAEDDPLAVTEA